jgi:8-oxo-dGTP pyrophosphatase MutT (NUDIX family)
VTHFAQVAVWDDRGRLLMQERGPDFRSDPSRWGLPGGSREGSETPVENAVRELEEETGLTGLDLTEIATVPFHSLEVGPVEYSLFGALLEPGAGEVECLDGRQMVFLAPDEIWRLDLTRATVLSLRRVLRHPAYVDLAGRVELPEQHRFSGVILVDRRGWVLLQERDEHPRIDPETWGLAGGHVEEGEDFEAAAHRELEEETGVRLEPGTLTLFGEFVVDHRAAYGTYDLMRVYAAATNLRDADIDCREGRQIVFVEPGVARGLRLSTAARDIVPAFLDSDLHRTLKEQP